MHRSAIEDWYGRVSGPPGQNFRLPFFLAAIVKRAGRPSDVFGILADIRRQATGFRARRAELDATLRTAAQPRRQLVAALEDEARGLLGRFPYVPAMAGIAAILTQAVKPRVGLTLPLICVACLTAGSRLPPAELRKFTDRIRRPYYWFLPRLADVAQGVVHAYPDVRRLWSLEAEDEAWFVDRFAALRSLEL